jgi:SAM-dependent methyltransferase
MTKAKIGPPSVPAEAYTRYYFEQWCDGHEEFRQSSGQTLPPRLQIPFDLADVRSDIRVLDIGCGRGELALHCAQRGAYVWGIDYSKVAIDLAKEALNNTPEMIRQQIELRQEDARTLSFKDASVDIAFMLDVVEHLTPPELDIALQEIFRVLKPGGRLIIHTMPNLWYYHLGYPFYRILQRLRGEILPPDPRDRWLFKDVHVNEQTPWSLYQTLRQNKFHTRVWLQSTQRYEYETNPMVRSGMKFLVSAPFLSLFFCNDIFAVAVKG